MWTKVQFDREISYQAAMAVAREMLAQGIIDEADYRVISTSFSKEFLPITAGLSL